MRTGVRNHDPRRDGFSSSESGDRNRAKGTSDRQPTKRTAEIRPRPGLAVGFSLGAILGPVRCPD